MADDKAKHGADRYRINVNEPYEMEYWTERLGVSAVKLKDLVKQHGVMAADIKRALKR